ncbi:piggyBac transposable element-derived protein 3-like [Rhopilema esculentum]|uniref:piggyBac transposable element-derived protein 3-like n=1 Tax=Rhopilema esculentum TaxID=499914 RepID=UPI0031DBA000
MRWTPTSVEEMRAFFGCLIYMGLCQLSDIRNYWSEALGQERISSVFSRNRFTDLFRYLHCNDNTMALSKNDPNHDKLHKVRPVVNLLQQSFKQFWVPHQQNSIDERMIPFTGRSSIKQYMKDKPNEWGFKMWKLVDSVSAYLYAFDIYTGKGAEREVRLGQHVVLKLAKELQLGQPWMLFFDNFFSSVDLIDQLFERGKLATATIRPNRAGLPIEVKNAKLETGEMIWRMKDPQTVVTKWKDTKEVLLISSMSRAVPSETDFVTKSQKGTAEKTTRTFSLCVIQYRKRMGGVDTNDQMIAYQNLSRKSYRWWVPIFLDLFKQAIVNAWILEQYQPDAKKRGQKEFRIELFQSLVGTFSARKREAGQQPNATKRFDGNQHFFVKSEKRGFCKNVCGSKVFYKCTKCEIFLCIVCFYNYHKRL